MEHPLYAAEGSIGQLLAPLPLVSQSFEGKFCRNALQCLRPLCDDLSTRANKNITLTLSWNVVPNAGILPLVMGSGHMSVPFPESYETTKSY